MAWPKKVYKKLPILNTSPVQPMVQDNTAIIQAQDPFKIDEDIKAAKKATYNWFKSDEAKPPVSNISYGDQVIENIKKGLTNTGKVMKEIVAPAAASAALTMAAPATASTGLGLVTVPQMLSSTARAMIGGVGMDSWYKSMGGETVGEMLDIQGPVGRFADMVSC